MRKFQFFNRIYAKIIIFYCLNIFFEMRFSGKFKLYLQIRTMVEWIKRKKMKALVSITNVFRCFKLIL